MNAEAHNIAGRRAPRITAEDVFRAADQLVIDGYRPTIDRIRMQLGRGSPNTINEHLDQWWRNLGARLTAVPGQTFPGVPDAVGTLLQQLWSVALTQAQEVLHAALNERERQLQERAAQLASLESELDVERRALQAREETEQAALALARSQLEDAAAGHAGSMSGWRPATSNLRNCVRSWRPWRYNAKHFSNNSRRAPLRVPRSARVSSSDMIANKPARPPRLIGCARAKKSTSAPCGTARFSGTRCSSNCAPRTRASSE